MLEKVKKKVLEIIDIEADKIPTSLYVAVSILGILLAKYLTYSAGLILMVCITILIGVITFIEIVRKDRSVKKILINLAITFFLAIITILMWLAHYYIKINDDKMFANIIKVFWGLLALVIDILAIAVLKNEKSSKSKKNIFVISMIFISVIAVLGAVFLPPKGM